MLVGMKGNGSKFIWQQMSILNGSRCRLAKWLKLESQTNFNQGTAGLFFSELEVGLLPLPRSERWLGPALPGIVRIQNSEFCQNLRPWQIVAVLGLGWCWRHKKHRLCSESWFHKQSGIASFSSNLDGLSTGKALVVPEEALVHLTRYLDFTRSDNTRPKKVSTWFTSPLLANKKIKNKKTSPLYDWYGAGFAPSWREERVSARQPGENKTNLKQSHFCIIFKFNWPESG